METRIYYAKTDLLYGETVFSEQYKNVPEQRQSKIDCIRTSDGKVQALGAWLLLKKALSDCGIDADEIKTKTAQSGKPYITNYDLCFNLSHSGVSVMCALSEKEVGCDVEKIRRADLKLAKRFFSEPEYELLSKIKSPQEQDTAFYKIWTLKESYIKAKGMGLSMPLNSFSVVLQEKEPIIVDAENDVNGGWHLRSFDTADGYVYSCCCLTEDISGLIECDIV